MARGTGENEARDHKNDDQRKDESDDELAALAKSFGSSAYGAYLKGLLAGPDGPR